VAKTGRPPYEEGMIRSRWAGAPSTPTSVPWVLAATIIGSAMAFIDGTITNVALRQTQARPGATAVDAQWRDAHTRARSGTYNPAPTMAARGAWLRKTTWVRLRGASTAASWAAATPRRTAKLPVHFHEAQPPIVISFEPGEDRWWCYVYDVLI